MPNTPPASLRPTPASLNQLLVDIRACRVCEPHLPLGPRPIVRASPRSRILLIGQAPGIKVHESGVPWNDVSGRRLREWLGVDADTFYDIARFAIVPMGMCYPGMGRSGDLPPRPECAPLWHARLFALLPHIRLTVVIGQYAHAGILRDSRKASLTDTVAAWREYAPSVIALPHPSPRNLAWFKHRPWFDAEIVPMLRQRVRAILEE